MIDINKAIAAAVRTGKVSFGTASALQNAKLGKAKLIVIAANCPKQIRDDIEYHCKLSGVPFILYKGSSVDLSSVCGKPFPMSALSIREPGDSEILKLTEESEEEETIGGNE
ncbi:MAG: 50S ribosomal protein L30e [Candidatus Bathyarchaeia archaeon]